MGTSTSALELSRKFARLADGIERSTTPAERAGAAIIEREVRGKVRAATGGDFALSGMQRKGATSTRGRIGVRSEPARGREGRIVRMTGPAQLVENDVDKHYVVSRYAKGAQRIGANGRRLRSTRQSRIASVAFGQGAAGGGRRAVLNLGNGKYLRWTVAYSKGRHPWRDGVRTSRPRAAAAMRREETKPLFEVFK